MKRPVSWFVAVVLFIVWPSSVIAEDEQAEIITVAVASNFILPIKALVEEFEKASNHRVNLAFGSSGKLYAQILNGAPYHLFFSADQIKPQTLESDGLVVESTRYTYALGKLALLKSPYLGEKDTPEELLLGGDFSRLAIANPRVAPYGQASLEVLAAMNVPEPAQGQIVRGENISQAYQFVSSGNVELGFVALSQLTKEFAGNSDQKGGPNSYWIVSEELYSPIRQDMVILKSAENSPAARSFYEWIKSDKAQMMIQSFGYGLE